MNGNRYDTYKVKQAIDEWQQPRLWLCRIPLGYRLYEQMYGVQFDDVVGK